MKLFKPVLKINWNNKLHELNEQLKTYNLHKDCHLLA